jgi:cell shape-determining protein MreC
MLTPRNIAIAVAALALQNWLGGGFSGLQEMRTQGEQNRALRSTQQQEQARLTLAQDSSKQKDAIARQRYQDGCVMVVSANDKTQLTAITEGLPVIDASRNVPLSAGNIVCDQNGLTGEIIANPTDPKVPVVGNTAFTSDRALVANAAKRYRGTRYTMPKQ